MSVRYVFIPVTKPNGQKRRIICRGHLELSELIVVSLNSPLSQVLLLHRKLLKYHYFTDTHNVPLADEDSETPVEWSQIKRSGVKFFSLGEKQ